MPSCDTKSTTESPQHQVNREHDRQFSATGPAAHLPVEQLSVLFVEDDPVDCELLLQELRRAGFLPTWDRVDTENGFRQKLQPGLDVVISDFRMPAFDGTQALEILKRSRLDIPFILVSGIIGEDAAVAAMKNGATDYLMKDRIARLGPAVRQALQEVRLRREQERARAEQTESRAFVDDVLNSLTTSVAVLDPAGNIIATNEVWRRFGREHGGTEIVDQNFLTVCDASAGRGDNPDAQAVARGVRQVLEGRAREFSLEFPAQTSSGKQWFRMQASPLGDRTRGVVVTYDDVTARRVAEDDLREREERFRQLIDHVSDLVAVVNEFGLVTYQSPSAQRLLGYEMDDVAGRQFSDFIHPDDLNRVREHFEQTLGGSTTNLPVEHRVLHRDGSWRFFQSNARLMTGTTVGRQMVVCSRDVSAVRKLEEQFLRAQRLEAVGTLSSGIAHDLNNILAPILMIAPLLRGSQCSPQELEMLSMMEKSAQRGANIIKQLLTFSRGIEGQRGPVQLRHLISEMAALMRETFPRDIAISQQVAPDLPPVIADATQIQQVVMNLCVNARDAMPAGGRLALTAKSVPITATDAGRETGILPGLHVCLSVCDTGEGISPDNLGRIFEPFFTTKDLSKGTGLGLSTVRGIVKSHGGFVTVESQPGRGTSFHVFIPAIAEIPVALAAESDALPTGKKELVLVVDDEPAVRQSLGLVLEQHNYRVLLARDGREAMSLFLVNRGKIQLVVTDIMMPESNGLVLITSLRELEPELGIIAASGLDDRDRREQLLRLGVTEILAKPASPRDLLLSVRRELE